MANQEPKKYATDDIKAYRKIYYEQNKTKYQKTETCNICGTTYQLFNKSHHKKTKKHVIANEIYQLKMKVEELNKQQNAITPNNNNPINNTDMNPNCI